MAATIDDRVAELERANAELRRQLDACGAELKEARDQQTATAEVLQVINSAPGDLAPVFDAILEKAHSLCEAPRGGLILYDGEYFRAVAVRGFSGAFADRLRQGMRGSETYFEAPLLAGERFIHISDQAVLEHPNARAGALAGTRTLLSVPLRKGDALLGMIVAGRTEVCPFTDKQIALLENFAAQAVIAMENARLLTETREALEQQTATSEVLQVINSSPGDLAPVFDAILEKAHTLCGATNGALVVYEDGHFSAVATRGAFSARVWELYPQPFAPAPGSAQERLLSGEDLVHIPEFATRPVDPAGGAAYDAGLRALLMLPLRKERTLLGYILASRPEAGPFTDKQIALLQNFAAQAVIAMENARLLTETREALEQQTATAEVLQVINSSPGDLAPVFDAMIQKAVRLCGAVQGSLRTFDGEALHLAAWHGDPSFAERARELGPIVLRPGHPMEPLLRGQRVVHLTDAREATANSEDSAVRERVAAGNIRSWLAVALRTDGGLLGSIAVSRQEVQPFSDKQIALLQNFAAQAVIAMENARLITETREALEQQTATAEVLQVINSSPGDLAPVFDAILEKARSLCGAVHGALVAYDGEHFRAVATHGLPEPLDGLLRTPFRPEPGSPHELLLAGQRLIHIADQAAREQTNAIGRASVQVAGTRTLLFIPLRKDDALLGYISAFRPEVRPFSDKQIALLQNFAAQAVIAMENARLLTETREALEQQTATAEVLQVINSSPGDLTPVFDAILEKAHSLCNSDHGTLFLRDGAHFRPAAIRGVPEPIAERLREGLGADAPVVRPLLAGEHFVHILDLARLYHPLAELSSEAGVHALLSVPLRKGDELFGMIVTARFEAGAFSQKQIALLQNFAAQAVIAMENARLITETREALEQQTATAEVLQVINSSPGDVQPTFDAIATSATRLCEAASGAVFRFDGSQSHLAAHYNCSPAELDALRATYPLAPSRGSVTGRAILTRAVTHVADIGTDPEYALPSIVQSGMHAHLSVPMLLDGNPIGAITVARREAKQFSETQIELLKTFAAQAVIAMENARLITETREALEQQTATAEVLQVINSSPGDLAPVFDAMLDRAMRLCGVDHAALELYDGERMRAVAVHGASDKFAETLRQGYPATESPASQTLLEGGSFVEIADAAQIDHVAFRTAAAVDGIRTVLFVPLQRDDIFLGMIASARREVRPFSEKEIALLQNFAAQAVIAMENARLLTETREGLEQQTATAEVLQVINSSPGDLAPVFDAMLDRAIRLCEAAHGHFLTYDGETFHPAAVRGEAHFAEYWRQQGAFRPSEGNPLFRLVHGERIIHLADAREDSTYRDVPVYRRIIDIGEIRTSLTVPLRKDGALLGAFVAYRQEVRPFSDKQIALLQNFAAQAVIAMENARLLTETREALEQQTATAEVLQVINSSPGDLTPVFDAMLEKAIRLCGGIQGVLWTIDGARGRVAAAQGVSSEFVALLSARAEAGTNPILQRVMRGERVIQILNTEEEEAYRSGDPLAKAALTAGVRTLIWVAMIREGAPAGAFAIARREVRAFTDKQIALLQNFAAQAVIAMENARLLTETREALEQQTATAEVLQVINSSPGDLAPVFDAILEKARSLCGAVHGALVAYDGEHFRAVATHGLPEPLAELLRTPFRPTPIHELLLRGQRLVHIADQAAVGEPGEDSPLWRASVDAGARTLLLVPLRKDGALLGNITASRWEVRPFSEKEIALLESFAAQAVIAMENARLITETREALEQQTATAEVLQVINSSPGDLAPVFDAMLEKAMRLCEAAFGTLWTYDGDRFRSVAQRGVPGPYADYLTHNAPAASAGTGRARILRGAPFVHVADLKDEEPYHSGDPHRRAMVDLGGARTGLIVPLRKDDAVIGFVMIYRQQVRPFSDKQIALLQNFAAQAVIAMENARLLTETREALEQQTATAEVLQVINSSPGDLAPVFDAILEKAHSFCGAVHGSLHIADAGGFRGVAMRGVPEAYADFIKHPFQPGPNHPVRELIGGAPFATVINSPEFDDPIIQSAYKLAGMRTGLFVPLRKDRALRGYIVAARPEIRPFTDKQIALLQNFAAQAVIAMENARLLNELRQRTSDLQEALDYQTATSDVLKVISQSNFDLGPVLGNVIETALRLCRAHMGSIFRLGDGVYRWAVGRGLDPAYQEIEMRTPILAGPGTVVGRAALEGRAVQIADAMADPLYAVKDEASLARARTMLGVPLLREGAPIGVIAMARDRVEPFSEREIALVTTFADQAVIAIENARLFDELRERTAELGRSVEELKMLGEVGRAVSSTLDLSAVLSTILTASLGMTWATAGAIFRYIRVERAFRLVEAVGWDEALLGSVGDLSIAETETAMSEAASRRAPIQLTDLAELPSTPLRDASLAAGLRSVLIVPLVGPERIFGALVLQRREAGEFPAETVRLMQTLASQSVLAIQNARLFREIADKSEQLALASQHKSQFLANMSHELRTPLNAILGYAELLVDGIYGVLPEKAQGVLERVQNNGKHLLALINDVLDLAKIEAGQLALTLEDYVLAEVVRSVVTATEPLAAAKGLKFTAIVQDGMPMAHGDARRVSQVLLNLAGNAIKFTDAGEVEINASAANGQFLLIVRDTGPGIADADQERIFGEFQQIENTDTRKKGGTGLGLAISKRMVEMQGGMISVESMLGRGSTFRVVLPIQVEPAMEAAA